MICNYVGFLWGLSLVRSHTEALFSRGILSSRERVTEGGWGRGLSRLLMLNSEGADMAARDLNCAFRRDITVHLNAHLSCWMHFPKTLQCVLECVWG